jgi:hypothetical protein
MSMSTSRPSLYFLLSDLRTVNPFSSHPAVLASSSAFSYSIPRAREALGNDEGHETTKRLGYFALKTDGRKTGGDVGKKKKGQTHVGRDPICYTLFELWRS